MEDDNEYHGADGKTGTLKTLDDIGAALSDLSQRVLALETRPAAPGDATATGTVSAEVERLRAVVEPFFGSELIAYDQRVKSEADARAAADANTGTDTAGK